MTTITLEQVKEKIPHNIYNYFEKNNLDGKDLNTIARTFFKDGMIWQFFSLVEVFNLEQYLDEYKDVLIENIDTRSVYKKTLLHYTSYYGFTEIAQFLLDNGADINAKDIEGKTPLYWASLHCNYKLMELLSNN